MRNYWNISLTLSLAAHIAVFLAIPTIITSKSSLKEKKDTKQLEVIVKDMKPRNTPSIKNNITKLSAKNEIAPPYMDNLVKKILLSNKRKITLNKPPVIDDALKNVIFSGLPKEKELKKNPAYMDYYNLIREKIRANAYEYYDSSDTGEVLLTFIILKSGNLDALYLNEKSVNNEGLTQIALKSIKDAAPFLPFPPELNYPKLQFNISIHFKND